MMTKFPNPQGADWKYEMQKLQTARGFGQSFMFPQGQGPQGSSQGGGTRGRDFNALVLEKNQEDDLYN